MNNTVTYTISINMLDKDVDKIENELRKQRAFDIIFIGNDQYQLKILLKNKLNDKQENMFMEIIYGKIKY